MDAPMWFPNRGFQWACRSSKCRGPCPCTARASEPAGGSIRGLTGLDSVGVAQFFGNWQSSGWGRAAGARLRAMRPPEGSTELTRPRSCLLVRQVVLEASGGIRGV